MRLTISKQYFDEVRNKQLSLSREKEKALLFEYKEAREKIYSSLLDDPKVIAYLIGRYNQVENQGKAVSKLSAKYKPNKKGINDGIIKRMEVCINKAKKNKNPLKRKELILEANFSPNLYDEVIRVLGAPSEISPYISKMREIEDILVRTTLQASVKIAFRYSKTFGIDGDDLVQVANLTVLDSVRKFDPENYKVKFITYAYSRALSKVKEYIMTKSRLIKLPNARLEIVFCILEAIASINKECTLDEVLTATQNILKNKKKKNIEKKEIEETLEMVKQSIYSIDTEPDSEEDGKSIKDFMISEEPSPEEAFEIATQNNMLREIIKNFPSELSKEQLVLRLRYLTYDFVPSLKEISGILEKEWGRKYTNQALRKIEENGVAYIKENYYNLL